MTDMQFPEGFARGPVRAQIAEIVRDQGPISGHEIVELLGKQRAVVSRILLAMQEANMVYIKSWVHPGNSNSLAPVWAWKTKPTQYNAKRPPPITRTEINKRWNSKNAAYRNAKQRYKRGTPVTVWSGLL